MFNSSTAPELTVVPAAPAVVVTAVEPVWPPSRACTLRTEEPLPLKLPLPTDPSSSKVFAVTFVMVQ